MKNETLTRACVDESSIKVIVLYVQPPYSIHSTDGDALLVWVYNFAIFMGFELIFCYIYVSRISNILSFCYLYGWEISEVCYIYGPVLSAVVFMGHKF